MAVSHVASVAGINSATTSDAIVIPTVLTGDLLVLYCTNKSGTADPSVTDDDSGTWARFDTGGAVGVSIWARRATAATTGKTVTASGFSTACVIGLSVYRGVTTAATFFENESTISQASGTETMTAITPTRNGSMICLTVFHRGAAITCATQATVNPPTTLVERVDLTNPTNVCAVMHASEAQVTAGDTGTISWNQTNSGHHTSVFDLIPESAQPPRSMHQNRMRRAA